MQAEQRRKIEDDRFEPQDLLWSAATVHGEDGTELRDLDVEATDNYVVIEEIEDGRIVFEVSAWPHLDKDGRLVFAGEPTEFYQLAETAQQEIDLARLGQDVTGAERALRTGDVFAVRGLPAARESIGQADEIWDVSLVARRAAQAALYGAAASTVEEEYAIEMVISEEYDDLPEAMAEGEFDVRQQAMPIKSGLMPTIGEEEQA
jgi:hypothetical protein